MDVRKLETTRDTALKYVRRCKPACPSSTSCRFRHARRTLREGGKPCTHARAWYTRFALKVPRIYGCSLYTSAILSLAYLRAGTADPRDLAQAANDTVLFELLLDRRTRCQADWRAFVNGDSHLFILVPTVHRGNAYWTITHFSAPSHLSRRLVSPKP